MRRLLLALATLLPAAPAAAQPQAAPPAVDYANEANWLCRPGREDPCGRPLATVALSPRGYGSVGESRPAEGGLPAGRGRAPGQAETNPASRAASRWRS